MTSKKVGEIIRIEYDQDTGDLRVVIDITNQVFKAKVLNNKDLLDLIQLSGRDAIVVASKE